MTEPSFISWAFDPSVHDSHRFDSGEAELDYWLVNYAESAARARVARTFVWIDGDSRVVGYYSLSAHAVLRIEASPRIARGVPDPVPAALIAKLALHRQLHGQGFGRLLLADALRRIMRASQQGPAVRAIVVDASTTRGRRLYESFGFVQVPDGKPRMMVRASAVERALSI